MTGAAYSRPLQGLRGSDAPEFGGKSAALGELLQAEIPVPPGFALSTAAFEAFMEAAELEKVTAAALDGLAVDRSDDVARASASIAEVMREAPVPARVTEEIEAGYEALNKPAVAVRSSAVGEDSAEATFAGQQDSYLWVRGAEAVVAAVRDCWASLYSAPAISYRARLSAERTPAMGVTIQLMVDAEVSGVMFTCNPVSGDPSMVAINASWGLGLAVVGGEVTPDDYLVSKITGELVRHHTSTKSIEFVPRDDGRGTERREVDGSRQEERCLDDASLKELVEIGRRVERHFGTRQDIEWAIDHHGEIFVVQSRPVTGIKQSDKPRPTSALSMIMSTFGAPPKHGS